MKKLVLALALLSAFANGPISAQTFQNGLYYANPSWDQQLPAGQRFIVLSNWNNAAVLDRETGLVWERTPAGNAAWSDALASCHERRVSNRFGWRLPSVEELATLLDQTQQNPPLPAGHPFQGVLGGFFWTASTDETNSALKYGIDLNLFGSVTSFTASALAQTDSTGRRLSLARIAAADLVQTKGLGWALCSTR
jgi:Protein of unknown function (DUF1566)